MEQLVFVCPKGMGYPVKSGYALYSFTGEEIILDENEILHISHPCDMLSAGNWHLWQHECFVSERVQPFKQIFREVYVVTDAEKNEDYISRRFNGHNIKSYPAIGLFRSQGWDLVLEHDNTYSPQISYPENRITAHSNTLLVGYGNDYIETFEDIYFIDYQNNKIPLEDVPPIIFSETMREIDLVVSVAFAGDSPWEGTTSTIENRIALIRETCSLLNLGNVLDSGHFAVVEGMLASYKVHLGSGSSHQVPGNYVCVIPDNTKDVGKLFLPFIDKDQITSIVLSKIILLARDDKINDPVILSKLVEMNN